MPRPRRVALMFRLDRADTQRRELMAGIRRYARQVGHWHCVVDPFAAERLPGAYDGVLAPGDAPLAQRARRAGTPVVFVTWRSLHARGPRVVEDRRRAGALAADHLLDCGCPLFGYLGFLKDPHARVQLAGFGRVFRRIRRRYSFARIPMVYHTNPARWASLCRGLERWLDELPKPVGIFACRDVLARYLAEICRRKGLAIPEDVGLIGAGNDPAVCEFPAPSLTSVEFKFELVGERAAGLLDRLMAGELPPGRWTRIVPRLVVRDSTARRLEQNPAVDEALAYIAQHSHRGIGVAEVARHVGLGQRALLRRFRAVRRRSIIEEIVLARLGRVETLLATTDLGVGEIAQVCGFRTRAHLTRLFRRHTGLTPSAYRRRHR